MHLVLRNFKILLLPSICMVKAVIINVYKCYLQSIGIDMMVKSGGPWTVFAPSNSAWNKLPEGTVDYLLSEEVNLKHNVVYYCMSSLDFSS